METSRNNVETSIALVNQELINFSKLFERLQDSVEKINSTSSDVTRLLALHEQRLEDLYQRDRVLENKLDGKHTELAEQMKELHSHIRSNNRDVMDRMKTTEDTIRMEIKHVKEYIERENTYIQASVEEHKKDAVRQKEEMVNQIKELKEETSKRISALERWRYITAGGITVIVWAINKFGGSLNIL